MAFIRFNIGQAHIVNTILYAFCTFSVRKLFSRTIAFTLNLCHLAMRQYKKSFKESVLILQDVVENPEVRTRQIFGLIFLVKAGHKSLLLRCLDLNDGGLAIRPDGKNVRAFLVSERYGRIQATKQQFGRNAILAREVEIVFVEC
jgi:hypothetical protein